MTDEATRHHLDIIQSVVNRLSGHSFSIKAWSVGLVSGIMIFAQAGSNARYAAFALLPCLAFWWLDAYYIRLERLYRQLYEAVLSDDKSHCPSPHSMSVQKYAPLVDSEWRIMVSKSVVPLHLAVLVGIFAAYLAGELAQYTR